MQICLVNKTMSAWYFSWRGFSAMVIPFCLHCILSMAVHGLVLESQRVGTVPEMYLGRGIKKVEGILWT